MTERYRFPEFTLELDNGNDFALITLALLIAVHIEYGQSCGQVYKEICHYGNPLFVYSNYGNFN